MRPELSSSIFGFAFKEPGFAGYISLLALIACNMIACALMALMTRSIFEKLEMS